MLLANSDTISHAAAHQWVGALVCGAISVALMAWLARTLGAADFALFGATLNAALIALTVLDGGWGTLMYRELAKAAPPAEATSLPAIAIAHSFFLLLPCMAMVMLLTANDVAAVAATICALAVVLMNQRSARMRAARNFSGEAVWQICGRVVSAAAIIIALTTIVPAFSDGAFAVTCVFLAWAAGLAACLLFTASQWWRAPRFESAQSLYPLATSLLLVELSVALITKGDLVLISVSNRWFGGMFDSDVLTGYAASARLVEALLLGVAPLSNVVIAFMNPRPFNGEVAPRRVVLVGAFVLWLGGWALWGAGLAYGASLLRFIFGAGYEAGAVWLPWASLPLPWMLANLLLLQAVIAVAAPRSVATVVAACSLGFLAGAVVLAHGIGAMGIGIAAALAQAAMTIFLTRRLIVHGVAARQLS